MCNDSFAIYIGKTIYEHPYLAATTIIAISVVAALLIILIVSEVMDYLKER